MAIGQNIPTLITPGVMASELRVPLHRIVHILATRPHIKPTARAGTLRLYSNESLSQVRHELSAMDARHSDRSVSND